MNLPPRPPTADPHPSPHAAAGATPAPRLGRYALFAVAIIAVAFVAGLVPRLRGREAVLAMTRELSVATVTVVSPAPAPPAAPLALPAEIRAAVEASINARATGYVKHWYADLGTHVTNGQVLAVLETPEVDQDLATSRAQLRQSEAAAALAASTARRWTELSKAALVSPQETDEKLADARLKAAVVESAQANVHRLEELSGFGKITAPFDGTITARRIDVGQLVVAGTGTELFHLAQTRTLRVFVRVPQTVAQGIAAGQEAEVVTDTRAGRRTMAKVVRTAGALDTASRTLLTELELPNADGALLHGGYAQVLFTGSTAEVPLTVMANTLLFRPEGPRVAVVGPSDVIELRAVVLGRDLGARVEILGGVTPADRLVLNPSDSITAGSQVRVAAASPTAPAR